MQLIVLYIILNNTTDVIVECIHYTWTISDIDTRKRLILNPDPGGKFTISIISLKFYLHSSTTIYNIQYTIYIANIILLQLNACHFSLVQVPKINFLYQFF